MPGDFLIPLFQWEKKNCNSTELNHCTKKVLESKEDSKMSLGNIFLCLTLYFSHRGIITFSPGLTWQLKGYNEVGNEKKTDNEFIE